MDCRPVFVGGSFIPSIPQISKDLDATPAAVRYVIPRVVSLCIVTLPSLGVSLSVFASAVSVVFWSAYTSFCRSPRVFCIQQLTSIFDCPGEMADGRYTCVECPLPFLVVWLSQRRLI
jgi:hypothetical protein